MARECLQYPHRPKPGIKRPRIGTPSISTLTPRSAPPNPISLFLATLSWGSSTCSTCFLSSLHESTTFLSSFQIRLRNQPTRILDPNPHHRLDLRKSDAGTHLCLMSTVRFSRGQNPAALQAVVDYLQIVVPLVVPHDLWCYSSA